VRTIKLDASSFFAAGITILISEKLFAPSITEKNPTPRKTCPARCKVNSTLFACNSSRFQFDVTYPAAAKSSLRGLSQ
jgi:hypothetical protein